MPKETTENQDVKSKKDLLRKRLATKYPGEDFSDDEYFAGKINDDYDDYDKKLGEYKDREKKLGDMFGKDYRSATFLKSWMEGGDPVISLIKTYGDDFKAALEDEGAVEKIAEANKEYIDRIAKEGDLDKEYQNNLQSSLAVIDEMQKKNSLPDEQIDNVIDWLVGISRDVMMGKFTAESLEMAMKAINHDKDVEVAARNAEVEGRNANIDLKLKKEKRGDGTASSMSSANGVAGRNIEPNKQQQGKVDIWKVGNEKRIQHRV
jgi:hypothetical protein